VSHHSSIAKKKTSFAHRANHDLVTSWAIFPASVRAIGFGGRGRAQIERFPSVIRFSQNQRRDGFPLPARLFRPRGRSEQAQTESTTGHCVKSRHHQFMVRVSTEKRRPSITITIRVDQPKEAML
jgi:hypothetical protein